MRIEDALIIQMAGKYETMLLRFFFDPTVCNFVILLGNPLSIEYVSSIFGEISGWLSFQSIQVPSLYF